MTSSIGGTTSGVTNPSSNRLTGLISGMDTDQIVKDMSKGTLMKIAKMKQQRQTFDWKKTAYRSASTSILNFSEKFLSSTSVTNLKKSSFFQSATITSLGSNASAVSISGTSDVIANFSIGSVSKLATTAGITTASDHEISSRNITTGNMDLENGREVSSLEDTSITLSYGGKSYMVRLSDIELSTKSDASEKAKENAMNVETAFNSALKSAGLDGLLSAKLGEDGKITFNDLQNNGDELKVSAGSTVLLKAVGLSTGDSASDGSLTGSNDLKTAALVKQVTFGQSIAQGNGTITLDLNGTKAVVNLKELVNEDGSFKDLTMNMEKLATHINDQLAKNYGIGKVNVSAVNTDGTPITLDATQGKLIFETTSTTSILSVASGDSGVIGATGAMNVNLGDANRLLLYEPLTSSKNNLGADLDFSINDEFPEGKTYSMTMNDVSFEVGSNFIKVGGVQKDFAKGVTMNDMINTINNSDAGVTMKYLATSDRFSVMANHSGSEGKVDISGGLKDLPQFDGMTDSKIIEELKNMPESEKMEKLQELGELGGILFGTADERIGDVQGTDSEMKVSFDGGKSYETVSRTSNSFALDGMNISLNSTFTSAVADPVSGSGDAITFSSKANSDEVVSSVKTMVEEYNKMIEKINSLVSTKPDRSYKPLTDQQKEGMSEKEIEKWEEKAQEGILFGDDLLRSVASDLRFNFSIEVDGIAMNQIGIKSGTSYQDNGKIILDETMFRKALEEKPDAVAKLFTADGSNNSAEKGAMTRIEDMVNRYTKTTGSIKGSLIQKAGHTVSPTSETNNTIYKQMKSLSDQIKVWETKLKKEQDRYYSKFTNMEVFLNKMNAQSSWLTDQFAS